MKDVTVGHGFNTIYNNTTVLATCKDAQNREVVLYQNKAGYLRVTVLVDRLWSNISNVKDFTTSHPLEATIYLLENDQLVVQYKHSISKNYHTFKFNGVNWQKFSLYNSNYEINNQIIWERTQELKERARLAHIENFNKSHRNTNFVSYKVDSDDIPYIAYNKINSKKIYITKFVKNHWVAIGEDVTNNCSDLDIAISGQGIPFAVYIDNNTDYRVSIKKFDGVNWVYINRPHKIRAFFVGNSTVDEQDIEFDFSRNGRTKERIRYSIVDFSKLPTAIE